MTGPVVAVVIPVYKQSSLVIEAIESALRQQTTFDYRLVVVNDGCPFAETDDVCRTYARAYPQKVRYLRRRNGGLSAARNAGVDAALSLWPSVEAIQMLDADDRLGPRALQIGFDALQKHPEASWVRPNCRRFSFGGDYVDSSGAWSVLELMLTNYVLCASMIRRSVFERGLCYDEQMRLGFEDWDLWIQCAEAGLRGVHAPEMEFEYRQRGESMLSGSGRDHEQIVAYMRRKHAELYTPRRTIELEQSEMPRYAIYLTDTRRVLLTSDPIRWQESHPVEDVLNRLTRHITHPQRARFPRHFVVTSEAFLKYAEASAFVGGLFWLLQTQLEIGPQKFAAAIVEQRFGPEYSLEIIRSSADSAVRPNQLAMIMTSSRLLDECLLDTSGRSWLEHVFDTNPGGVVSVVEVRCIRPCPPTAFPPDALQGLRDLLDQWGPFHRASPRISLIHGKGAWRFTGDASELTERLFGAGPLLPRMLDRTTLNVAHVVPVCEFGGAERVSMNFARESRRRGWRAHLFVLGTRRVHLLREFEGVFDTVTVVDDPAVCTPLRLVGLLGTMDVVVSNNCGLLNPVLGLLHRAGVKTFAHIHLASITADGFTTGQVYEAVRYEHSLDGVLVISRRLGRWCRAWGIPEAKIIHVPNAPSFSVSDALMKTTMIQRAERIAEQPLRVLFLGRFDHEKGLDRLAALYEQARHDGLPLEWQVVGKYVCDPDGSADSCLAPLRPLMRPPALTAPSLSRLLVWADILLLPSRNEGVPLIILEAQQLGCVVFSTNVGAIDEIVEHERTGFLFSNELDTPTLVGEMVCRLRKLSSNRARMMQVAAAAMEFSRQATWNRSFEPFARAVEALCVAKEGNRQ